MVVSESHDEDQSPGAECGLLRTSETVGDEVEGFHATDVDPGVLDALAIMHVSYMQRITLSVSGGIARM